MHTQRGYKTEIQTDRERERERERKMKRKHFQGKRERDLAAQVLALSHFLD